MHTAIWRNGNNNMHRIKNNSMKKVFGNLFRSAKQTLAPGYYRIPEEERMSIIERSCKQVSRGVFFSTVIIITSFLPVFLLSGQEAKLFHPLT